MSSLSLECDDKAASDWLKENGFGSAVVQALQGYTGSDIWDLSKQDAKDLLGMKEGIRLFNRVHRSSNEPMSPSSPSSHNNNSHFSHQNGYNNSNRFSTASTTHSSFENMNRMGSIISSNTHMSTNHDEDEDDDPSCPSSPTSQYSDRVPRHDSTTGIPAFITSNPILSRMHGGTLFSRYSSASPLPTIHYFWYTRSSPQDLGSIHWCQPSDRNLRPITVDKTLDIDTLTDIYLGKEPSVFESPSAAAADDSRCFSLVSNHLILNLETADDEGELVGIWLTGLQYILESSGSNVILDANENKSIENIVLDEVEKETRENGNQHNKETHTQKPKENEKVNEKQQKQQNEESNNPLVTNSPLVVTSTTTSTTSNPLSSDTIAIPSGGRGGGVVDNSSGGGVHKRTTTIAGSSAVMLSLASRSTPPSPSTLQRPSSASISSYSPGSRPSKAPIRLTIVGGVGQSAADLHIQSKQSSPSSSSTTSSDSSMSSPRSSRTPPHPASRLPPLMTAFSLDQASSSPSHNPRSASVSSYFKAGYLVKLGSTIKNWKKRYFKINGAKLEYYIADKQPFKLVGSIPMAGARLSTIPSDTYGKSNLFGITPLNSSRTYILEAPSALERADWLAALTSHVHALRLKHEADHKIIKMGLIRKLGYRVQNWQWRHFVLYNSGLCEYYEVKLDANQIASMSSTATPPTPTSSSTASTNTLPPSNKLSGSFHCSGARILDKTPSNLPNSGSEHTFSIQPSSGDRIYYLSSLSLLEKQAWTSVFTQASLIQMDPSRIDSVCEGYLYKQGGVVGTTWQERYMILNRNGKLKYYRAKLDVKHAGEIKINNQSVITREPEENKNSKKDRDFIFSLQSTPTGRKYFLSATNDSDRERWISAIEEMIEESGGNYAKVEGAGVWSEQDHND